MYEDPPIHEAPMPCRNRFFHAFRYGQHARIMHHLSPLRIQKTLTRIAKQSNMGAAGSLANLLLMAKGK